jgi:hypothetical protein
MKIKISISTEEVKSILAEKFSAKGFACDGSEVKEDTRDDYDDRRTVGFYVEIEK